MRVTLIAAMGKNRVIGVDGDLPWNLPNDMKFFSKTTKGHHVIMGRKNYESIPDKYRPLPGRPNLVVTRQKEYTAPNVDLFNSIEEAILFAQKQGEEELFIIGGGQIYTQTTTIADRILLTIVDASPEGDAHFPSFEEDSFQRTLIMEQSVDELHNHAFKIYEYLKRA